MTPPPIFGLINAETVGDPTLDMSAQKHTRFKAVKNVRLKYLCFYYCKDDCGLFLTTTQWSETASLLPDPPENEVHNLGSVESLWKHSELFKIATLINIKVLEKLLKSHPNWMFVDLVRKGLKKGFWPFAEIHLDLTFLFVTC